MALTTNKVQGEIQSGKGLQEIERAKNFIWEHLPSLTKEFIISISQMDEATRKAQYSHKFQCHLEGKVKDNVIVKEIAVLSLGEIHQNSISEPSFPKSGHHAHPL